MFGLGMILAQNLFLKKWVQGKRRQEKDIPRGTVWRSGMGEKREWRQIGVLVILLVLAIWAPPVLAEKGASRGDAEIFDACFGSVCVAKATPMSDTGMDWGDAARDIRTGESGTGQSRGGPSVWENRYGERAEKRP